MKTNRLLSALLAVMMVISMMACIAVPAMAIGTLPDDAVSVTTVTAAVEGAQNYKIETIADLVHLAQYVAAFDRDDTIYLANDIDAADYPGGKEAFSTAYSAYVGTSNFLPCFDGLGHTIYNYTATRALFGNYSPRNNGYLKNLTLEGASAATSGHQGLILYKPEAAANNNSTLFENIHVRNSEVSSTSGNSASIFGYLNTGNTKHFTFRNCSAVNVEVTSSSTYGAGVLLGRGRTSGVLLMENILVVGCTLNNAGKGTEGGGFVVGDVTADNVTAAASTFKNVGVFNNVKVLPEGTAADNGAAILTTAYGKSASTVQPISIDGIYAANNKIKLNNNSLVDHDRLINQGKNSVNLTSYTNYKSDAATSVMKNSTGTTSTAAAAGTVVPTYNALQGLADLNASAAYDNWVIDANGNLTVTAEAAVAPIAVSFIDGSVTTTYYTAVNGKIAVKADLTPVTENDFAALNDATWAKVDEVDASVVADWADVTFTADATYHKLTAVANGDKTHNVVCDVCVDHDKNNVACTEERDEENSVALGYFNKQTDAYKCPVCGHSWSTTDENGTYAAPYTIALDNDAYSAVGTEVKLNIAAKADADISAMKLSLTVSEYLDYVDYAPSAGYMVTVNEKADGTLRVILAKENGTLLTASDVATLTFVTKALPAGTDHTTLTVDATLTEAVVGTGDATAKKEALTKTASTTAEFSVFTFVAGDVDDNDEVDLLDAVLMIQKLNGTIGPDQGAAFQLIAADVNNSGAFDTADIVLMLQYCTGFEVELENATQEPTFVAVGA